MHVARRERRPDERDTPAEPDDPYGPGEDDIVLDYIANDPKRVSAPPATRDREPATRDHAGTPGPATRHHGGRNGWDQPIAPYDLLPGVEVIEPDDGVIAEVDASTEGA